MRKLKLTIILMLISALTLSSEAATRFINTNNIGGDTNISLFLADGDDVVSTSRGVPQVRMRLDTSKLVTVAKGNIKVEVYRSTDETDELVATFSYPVRLNQTQLDLRMNLPEFKNQSENFDFVVYDTDGNPRSKFRHSFASKELITLEPKPPMLDLVDEKLLSEDELQYIAKKFAISVVPSGQPTGMQKQDGVYNFQVPVRKLSGKLVQKNNITSNALDFDEIGTLSQRDNFDTAPKGTVFLDKETGLIYVKASDADGDWADPIQFTSAQVSNGDAGSGTNGDTTTPPAPVSNTTIITNPTTTIVQQLDPNQITNGSIAIEKLESVTSTQVLSLPLKDALRSAGAVFGTVAAGTMPIIRYSSLGSSAWSIAVPEDLLRASSAHPNLKLKINWSPSNNSGAAVDWRLAYSSFYNGDLISAAAVNNIDASSSAPAATLTLTETEFSIPISNIKDHLVLKLTRLDSRDIKPNLSSIAIEYPGRVLE